MTRPNEMWRRFFRMNLELLDEHYGVAANLARNFADYLDTLEPNAFGVEDPPLKVILQAELDRRRHEIEKLAHLGPNHTLAE